MISKGKVNLQLHVDAASGNLEGVKAFLARYPELIDEEADPKVGQQTALILSVRTVTATKEKAEKKFEVFKFLLEQGANPNIIDCRGMNALHYAVESRNLAAVKLLVNAGKINDINARDGLGFTALASAAFFKNYAICEFLLRQPDIDINCFDGGKATPINHASSETNSASEVEREKLFKLFIDHGADYKIKGLTESGKEIGPLDDLATKLEPAWKLT
ncbi:MAG: hypothetical protein K0R98_1834 [Rickettsiaceae bacterium]|nr:hypothetical protein [Rickettsiaceae bacterium]